MEINGVHVALLDMPADLTQEYNRWYDLDHLPEHVSKADVVMGRRYVADRNVRGLPRTLECEAWGGHPPYLTVYSFGGPLDMASEEAREGWLAKDRVIIKQGRYFREGRVGGGGLFRVAEASARPHVLVAPEAIAHLAHRGVIVAYGKAPSAERRAEAVRWWRDTHLVDLSAVPGVLAALRCDPLDETSDHLLHLLLCEDSVRDVMPRIDDALRYATAVGRFPAHKGAYEPVAFLPYERIVPLEYDFDFGED